MSNPDQIDTDNFFYFKSENKCYNSMLTGSSLNTFINDNFDIRNFKINQDSTNKSLIEDCQNWALESNKDFFLITDASINVGLTGAGTVNYNCLIPKVDKKCDFNKLDNLLSPFNNVLNDLFGERNQEPNTRREQIITNEDELLKSNINNRPNLGSCFFMKNTDDSNTYFAKNGQFILYKTELIDDPEYVAKLKTIKSYKYYQNVKDTEFKFKNRIVLSDVFKEYICNPSNNNETKFNIKMDELRLNYRTMFDYLNSVSRDISTISILTKYDTLYLEKLQKEINEQKNQLNNLLGFDGGNNGKLNDTQFLKNVKITEICSLFIIMTFVIFIYSKK